MGRDGGRGAAVGGGGALSAVLPDSLPADPTNLQNLTHRRRMRQNNEIRPWREKPNNASHA